jgi:hypothetical protein
VANPPWIAVTSSGGGFHPLGTLVIVFLSLMWSTCLGLAIRGWQYRPWTVKTKAGIVGLSVATLLIVALGLEAAL